MVPTQWTTHNVQRVSTCRFVTADALSNEFKMTLKTGLTMCVLFINPILLIL